MIKNVTTKNFDEFWQGFYHAVNTRIDCCTLDFVEERVSNFRFRPWED